MNGTIRDRWVGQQNLSTTLTISQKNKFLITLYNELPLYFNSFVFLEFGPYVAPSLGIE